MRVKAAFILAILLFILSMLIIFCNRQRTEWKGSIEEIDGLTVVKYPKEPMSEGKIYNKSFI